MSVMLMRDVVCCLKCLQRRASWSSRRRLCRSTRRPATSVDPRRTLCWQRASVIARATTDCKSVQSNSPAKSRWSQSTSRHVLAVPGSDTGSNSQLSAIRSERPTSSCTSTPAVRVTPASLSTRTHQPLRSSNLTTTCIVDNMMSNSRHSRMQTNSEVHIHVHCSVSS